MTRSGGVLFSAIIVFIGSAFTLLIGVFAIIGGLMASNMAVGASAQEFRFVIVFEALLYLGFGSWGVASGVGLIRLKQWARISMFVFAGLLLLMSVPAMLVMAFVPFPVPANSELPANFMSIMRVSIVTFFALLAALAGFWIYFFCRKNVKAQFSGAPPAVEGIATPLIPGKPSARPLSISIIGWYLLIASALSPIFLLFVRPFFPGGSMPLTFLGYFVFGRTANLILVATAVLQIAAAIGLLKLQNWGRLVTIGLQVLTIVNLVLAFGPPANRARFDQYMQTAMASVNPQMPPGFASSFPGWIGGLVAIPIVAVILWFLFAEKRAFVRSEI